MSTEPHLPSQRTPWRLAWTLAVLLATALPARAAVSVAVTPAQPLMDQRLGIAIQGLTPRRPVTVAVRTHAPDGLIWRSRAVFRADARGVVDLTGQAPISGGYRGADAMGLFWSMAPDARPKGLERTYFETRDPARPNETNLSVEDAGREVAGARIVRRYAAPNVRATAMTGGGHGTLYAPGDGARHPGVLVLGGSDGGEGAPQVAMLLASHGYAALSLAYFGETGLPPTLERVPMETFASALAWMRRQPAVDPRFIAIYGESRGTEAALWTAAHDPGVKAVVARSPSFALWGGVAANHLPGGGAWTQGGKPLPYIPNRLISPFLFRYLWDTASRTPIQQTPLFLADVKAFGDTSRTEIRVEAIAGPILLLAGKDDQIWPSYPMAKRIMARLRRHGHAYPDALTAYEQVGHPIPYAYIPLGGDRRHARFDVGGTPGGAARAQADAWPRILAFLAVAARAAGV